MSKKLKKKIEPVVLTGDTTDPSTWDMYSFEKIPGVCDSNTLDKKELIIYAIVMGASLVIYFGICFLI